MQPFLGEMIGTALLVLLGNGVVANVLLKETKGHNGGWIVITFGWAIAVFVAVLVTAGMSGAHLNPAVTLGMAGAGKFEWALVPLYLAGQLAGAMIGATLVWLTYKPHLAGTADAGAKLGMFCTSPAIRRPMHNLFSEVIGTFVLVYAVLHITHPHGGLGSLEALPVAFVVLGIGLSLGGTTGYAINPARDFGPRLMHALLPIPGKGSSDWRYAPVPVIGPVIGAVLAGVLRNHLERQ